MSKTLLVQGAVMGEISCILQSLPECANESHCGYSFFVTHCEDMRVIVSRTEIGTFNAAIATCVALERYKPDWVINQGTGGGHIEQMVPGDIVLGENAIQINDMTMPIRPTGAGSNALEWMPGPRSIPIPCDPSLLELAQTVPYKDGSIHIGTLGTGDLFSREVDRIRWLHERFGNLCEDMETAAVYKACSAYNVPVLGIRVISNNELTGAHEGKGNPYWKDSQRKLQAYILELIRALAESCTK